MRVSVFFETTAKIKVENINYKQILKILSYFIVLD